MVDGPAGGLKLAYYRQNHGLITTPQTIDRTVHADEVEEMVHRARQLFPHLSGRLVKAATCMYASAPDDAFVLGPLGGTSQVVLACGFSGHGFKFVPVVGGDRRRSRPDPDDSARHRAVRRRSARLRRHAYELTAPPSARCGTASRPSPFRSPSGDGCLSHVHH
jgi:hypothetical protein